MTTFKEIDHSNDYKKLLDNRTSYLCKNIFKY